jgi:transcriptional regulator with XRE-family HTH domain
VTAASVFLIFIHLAVNRRAAMVKRDAADCFAAQRLHSLRTTQNITEQRLANLLGVAPAHIWQMEKGTRLLTAGNLYHLAEIFAVSPLVFFAHADPALFPPALPDASVRFAKLFERLDISDHDLLFATLHALLDRRGQRL